MGKSKNKSKGLTKEREIKYWLLKNSSRGNNWVVLSKISEIISHPQKTLIDVHKKPLSIDKLEESMNSGLKYVYSTYLTPTLLISLLETNDGNFFVIKNVNRQKKETKGNAKETEITELEKETEITELEKETEKKEKLEENEKQNDEEEIIKSDLILCNNIMEAINLGFKKTDRNLLNIVKTDQMKLKKDDYDILKNMVAIDFMNLQTPEEKEVGWNKFLQQKKEQKYNNIDLSGILNIGSETLEKSKDVDFIEEIIFYQNVQISKFDWLKKFTNLKTLGLWFCYQITNDHIQEICHHCPQLKSINLHNCFQLNNRALIPIIRSQSIEKVVLDNKLMVCQTNLYQGVITDKEWEILNNHKVKHLLINSDNLTIDVIDHVLRSFHSLERFLMNSLVLKRLHPTIVEGYGPEKIIFQSSDNPKEGFAAKKDIKIKDLIKNKFEAPFSDAMKKVMHQQGDDLLGDEELYANETDSPEEKERKLALYKEKLAEYEEMQEKIDEERRRYEEELEKEIEEELNKKYGKF